MAPKEANEGLTIIEKDSENGKKDTTSLQSLSLRLNTTGSSSNNEQHHYEPSKFEKFLNYILCRNDLSKQTLEAKPVTIIDLHDINTVNTKYRIDLLLNKFRYAKKFDLFLIFIGLVCATINGIGQPVLSFLGGRIANSLIVYQVNSTEFVTTAYENVYYLAGLSCLIMITNFLQFICFQQCCIRMISKMRHEYMRSILRQNAAWFDKNHSGTLSVKLNDDMERIQEGVGDKLGLLFRGAVMFIAALGISFISDWRLTLVMSAIVPATCICMSIMARKMTATTDKELESVGEAGAIAEESLMGVRTVQAFNGQQEMVDRYGAALEQGKYHAIWKGFWSGFLGAIFFFILFIFLGGGFLYGAYLMNQGLITNVGTVFTVVVSLLIGGYFLGRISPHLMVLLNARVAAAVIYQTIDRVPEIDSYAEDGQVLTNPVGRVVFKDVHFRYPSRNDIMVLKGLNLVVEAGQTVALVGYSGCGKSTSVGLLTRLYESNSGSVTIDGIDVKDMNIKSLRSIVGIVQQEPCLFNDTVAGNLRNGNPDLTYEEMERICKMANADGFIKKLPKGYDTHIGDGGVQLSGGQKQRVAIARTLARDPKILLLDEATSALDAQSEGIVQEALNNASIGRSTIVIAHRLSTVRDADKIVLIEKGRAVEEGTHDQLIARKGMYYELVKAQQFQPETETKENKEDDIPEQLTRFSSYSSELRRSGRDLFIRGNSMNNSFNRSASKRMVDAESEAFAREVQRVMDEDSIMSAGYLDIYKNAIGNYHWLISGVICAICLGLQLPVLSFAYGYEFTVFQEDPSNSKIIRKALIGFLIYIGIGIGIVIFQTLSTVLFVLASENMTLRFRMMSFKNILCQDASYFDNPNHTPGKLIARLASDAPNTKAVIDERAMQLVCELTSLILCICLGTYYQWQIGLLGSCVVLTQFAIMTIIALIVMRKNLEIMTSDDGGIAIETIENVRTIQLLNRTQKFFDVYEEASKHQKRAKLTKGFFEGINFAITQSITCWMLAIGYSLGIYLVHNEIAEQASTFQAVNTMLMSSIAVMNAAPCFPEFIKAKSAASLLFSTIYRQPKTGDADMGDIDELKGEIMFDNVKFSYPQRPHQAVMRSLNFSAEKGQTVALVGPSGSGKSTCISMLERFYDCTSGTLRLDGKDIRSFSLNHLRTQMSLVGQEPRLFAGSIKQNICFGLKNVSTERIVNALKLSNAYTFVNGLPFGLDTEVGEKGAQLSGGQKQRIAIARALVRDPKILLLDEATSALDSESERAVQEALDRAREGRTCITIAHRLSSIQNAHIIVYIENGKVQESGNHTTLMQKRGKYYQLIKKQDLAM